MCFAAVMISRNCRQYGDGAMAGITVANKIFAVTFAVLVGYGQGFAPVCGFAYGAGLESRVKRSLRFTMITAVIFMCAMGAATWVWASGLAGVFLRDGGKQSLQLAALSLRGACHIHAVCSCVSGDRNVLSGSWSIWKSHPHIRPAAGSMFYTIGIHTTAHVWRRWSGFCPSRCRCAGGDCLGLLSAIYK